MMRERLKSFGLYTSKFIPNLLNLWHWPGEFSSIDFIWFSIYPISDYRLFSMSLSILDKTVIDLPHSFLPQLFWAHDRICNIPFLNYIIVSTDCIAFLIPCSEVGKNQKYWKWRYIWKLNINNFTFFFDIIYVLKCPYELKSNLKTM